MINLLAIFYQKIKINFFVIFSPSLLLHLLRASPFKEKIFISTFEANIIGTCQKLLIHFWIFWSHCRVIDRNNNFSLFLLFFWHISCSILVWYMYTSYVNWYTFDVLWTNKKNKIDTLILNMERDLSFISKKMFIFLCFSCKMSFIFIHIFARS